MCTRKVFQTLIHILISGLNFFQLFEATDDEAVNQILTSEDGLSLLESIGFRGNPMSVNATAKDMVLR